MFLFLSYIFSADIIPEMVKLGRGTEVKVFFPVLVYVFNFDLFKFSTAILEKGLLLRKGNCQNINEYFKVIAPRVTPCVTEKNWKTEVLLEVYFWLSALSFELEILMPPNQLF